MVGRRNVYVVHLTHTFVYSFMFSVTLVHTLFAYVYFLYTYALLAIFIKIILDVVSTFRSTNVYILTNPLQGVTMPTVPPHIRKQFTETEARKGTALAALISLLRKTPKACLVTANACAIYLPRFFATAELAPGITLDANDLAATRTTILDLVAPLRLDPFLPSGEAARELMVHLRGAHYVTCWSAEENRAVQVSIHSAETTQDQLALVEDLENYLVFRRVGTGEVTRMLPFIPPPYDLARTPTEYLIPERLRLVLTAWRLAAGRDREVYDTHKVGVDYATNGYLFINWMRFAESPYWPSWATLNPHTVDDQLRRLGGKLTLTPGMWLKKKKLPSHAPRIEQAMLDREMQKFVAACEATDAFVYDARDPACVNHCTMISPAYLRSKDFLNDGPWYVGRDNAGRMRKGYENTLQPNERLPPPVVNLQRKDGSVRAFPKLREVTFRPADWLEDVLEENPDCLWLPESHEETVWVHMRGDVPAIRPPRCINSRNPDCSHEFKVWGVVADWFKITEKFFRDGSFGNVVEKPKSEYCKGLRDDYLAQVGQRLISGFVSLDALPRTRQDVARATKDGRGSTMTLRDLKTHVSQEHLKMNPEASDGARWYHDEIMRATRERMRIPQLARTVSVLIPEVSPQPLPNQRFFMKDAIEVVDIVARASFNVLEEIDLNHHQMRQMLRFKRPAPVFLAWARMCKALIKGNMLPMERQKTPKLWSPGEDFGLVLCYRSRPGRMDNNAWRRVEEHTTRTQAACQRRVSYINETLKKMLPERKAHELRVGGITDNEARATRVVLLVGLRQAFKKYGLRLTKSHNGVRKIMDMSEDLLLRTPIPHNYATEYFYRFL